MAPSDIPGGHEERLRPRHSVPPRGYQGPQTVPSCRGSLQADGMSEDLGAAVGGGGDWPLHFRGRPTRAPRNSENGDVFFNFSKKPPQTDVTKSKVRYTQDLRDTHGLNLRQIGNAQDEVGGADTGAAAGAFRWGRPRGGRAKGR